MPRREHTGITGCFHIHIENGKIKNVFSHLGELPENGVIHMLPEKVYTVEEFKEDHFFDKDEVDVSYNGKIHNLHANSIVIEEDGSVKEEFIYDCEADLQLKKQKGEKVGF
jgi:hypothetical protein